MEYFFPFFRVDRTYISLISDIFVPQLLTFVTMENEALELQEGECYVGLTHDHLNVQNVMDRVRSPQAGAIVIFAGMFSTTT